MNNFLKIFKDRKFGLSEKCKYEYSKNLQTEITIQLERRSKKGLDFAARAYNKLQAIKSRIAGVQEPKTQEEFALAMKNLDALEAEFNAWLESYYYKLFPVYKPKRYGV